MPTLKTTALAAMTVLSVPALAADLVTYSTTDPINRLETMAVEGGLTRNLTVGFGSGAFRHADDPANIITVVSDRGPNFTCKAAKKVTGVAGETICRGRKVRIYATPDYTPSIYKLRLNEDGTFDVKDMISLKDSAGNPVDGMLNPLTKASTEIPIDLTGRKLAQNPSAVDAEGIVRLNDGTYWVSEENGPSVLHVAADGRIQKRIVPAGTEGDYVGAGYDIIGGLPEILYKRNTNRGIESMAVSPDESKLYFIMQNPLANPDKKTYTAARNTRLVVMDAATAEVTAQYVYQLTPYTDWPNETLKKQNTQRISEMLALGDGSLAMINDNDFGIIGLDTKVLVLSGSEIKADRY